MKITVKRLWHVEKLWHVSGEGDYDWSQPPTWPCSVEEFRAHAFPWASEAFLGEVERKLLFDHGGKLIEPRYDDDRYLADSPLGALHE